MNAQLFNTLVTLYRDSIVWLTSSDLALVALLWACS
jgi:hypothetical protein